MRRRARPARPVTDLLLLDYNGVIVNDEPIHFAALRDVLAVERVPMNRATYDAAYLGLDDRTCVTMAFAQAARPLEAAALERLAARKAAWYAETVRAGLPLVGGVRSFLRAAADAGIGIGVVSGALHREITAGLECAGIADLVHVVVGAEDVAVGKPDPSGYRLAIARLAGDARAPLRACALEDSGPGLTAARAAGAGCVLLATSFPRDRLTGGDAVWDSFAGHAPEDLAPLFREVDARPPRT